MHAYAGCTYRNAHAIHTQVAEAQDSRPICDNANLGIGIRPVLENGADRLALFDGDVQGLGPGIQGRVLQADIADGGGVDQRHQLFGMVDKEAVEQVDILALDGRQVKVLIDAGLPGADHLERTLTLLAGVLHDVRDQAGEVLGDALGRSEGQALNSGKSRQ